MSYLRLVALGALALASPSFAQAPQISRAEATQLYASGGFPIVKNHPTDPCGAPAKPTITFVDMNGDKRPEALFIDRGQCYLPDRAWFSIAAKGADGKWRQLVGQNGTVKTVGTMTGGWFDLEWTSNGKARSLRYNGTGYAVPNSLKAAAPSKAPAAAGGDASIFRAVGFVKHGNQWRSDCDDPDTLSYSPGTIESRSDLNGDGRPEVVVTEASTYCYGNTGTGFWLVSQQTDGSWKLMTSSQGIPQFLNTKGVDGWPDIQIGGPGFCFTVTRWNGKAFVPHRREYEGRPCK